MEAPSIEEVMASYEQLAKEHQQLINENIYLKQSNVKNRFDVLMRILENKEYYGKDILKLAHWHLKKCYLKNEF